MDVCVELLQDPRFEGHIDYHSKALFNFDSSTGTKQRVWGPFSSGLFWEWAEQVHPNKTVIPFIVYSDATEFYTGVSAHPVLGMYVCFVVVFAMKTGVQWICVCVFVCVYLCVFFVYFDYCVCVFACVFLCVFSCILTTFHVRL